MTGSLHGTDAALSIAVLLLLVVSGLFAMAETALVRMSKAKAKSLLDDLRHGADDLVELVEHPQRFLNPLLLCVLICQLISATLIGVLAERFFGAWGIAAATVFEVVVIFVVFEAVPKNWAVHHPERAALMMAPVVKAVIAFPPVRWVSTVLIGLANILIGHREDGSKGSLVTESELLAMADVAADDKVIENEERDYIGLLIEFGDTVVREVMVPRPDMVTLDADLSVTEALREALAAGFSRMPVCRESVDDVVGVAITKDLMRAEHLGHGEDRVDAHTRPARFLPETKKLSGTMREMQAERFHLALVVDEFGGTAGLVTLEDLIEELIGEITDEFDEETEVHFNVDNDGVVRVAGRLNLEDFGEMLGTQFPEGSWDTVAGLLLDVAGRVPKVGESVEVHGYRLTVERVKGRRIDLVRIDALEEDASA